MNILVTGANGFIGSFIINKLSQKYNFFKGTRQTIDLYSIDNIGNFLKLNKIDGVIHCATEGGSRLKKDEIDIFYKNLLIYKNLSIFDYKFFINFASGAEFDRRFDINNKNENEILKHSPADYYGLSKNIISLLLQQKNNCINLRIFGCFNYNELPTRFIRSNITRYIKNENMILHQDKYMDFIYLEDLCNIVEYYINNTCKHTELNATYIKKYKLSEIAMYINNLTSKKVPIIIKDNTIGPSYTGNGEQLKTLNLKMKGLEVGIEECFNILKYES